MEVSLKSGAHRPVSRPAEEELQRKVRCPHCTLDHAVFGLAFWCPDCGRDIFIEHVRGELRVLVDVLDAVPNRREQLGARVAARDVENVLEDLVSVFEAVLKLVTREHLSRRGVAEHRITEVLSKRVKNKYQNVELAETELRTHTGIELLASLDGQAKERLAAIFAKRHPITHNLGIVDRQYLARAKSEEREGREILVTAGEVAGAVSVVEVILADVYSKVAQHLPPQAADEDPNAAG